MVPVGALARLMSSSPTGLSLWGLTTRALLKALEVTVAAARIEERAMLVGTASKVEGGEG